MNSEDMMLDSVYLSQRLSELSKFGDPLERLKASVDFEMFRDQLENHFGFVKRKTYGRPHYDAVLIFKILILQSLYNLSDDQLEYQIRDRLSFMRFLDLSMHARVPDAKTVWLYRERLAQDGMTVSLFQAFDDQLRAQGYLAMGGQIVDASIIRAPRQRLNDDEKAQIKAGCTPVSWSPAKRAQKDKDARWILKHSKAKRGGIDMIVPYFGYKNHIAIDRRFGFIRRFRVTGANAYDGSQFIHLVDTNNTASSVWGDTAYASASNLNFLNSRLLKCQLHRRKSQVRHHKLSNRQRSSIRAKVEHVFAVQKNHMQAFIRTIGQVRATTKLTLINMAYNMKRLVYWQNIHSSA